MEEWNVLHHMTLPCVLCLPGNLYTLPVYVDVTRGDILLAELHFFLMDSCCFIWLTAPAPLAYWQPFKSLSRHKKTHFVWLFFDSFCDTLCEYWWWTLCVTLHMLCEYWWLTLRGTLVPIDSNHCNWVTSTLINIQISVLPKNPPEKPSPTSLYYR